MLRARKRPLHPYPWDDCSQGVGPSRAPNFPCRNDTPMQLSFINNGPRTYPHNLQAPKRYAFLWNSGFFVCTIPWQNPQPGSRVYLLIIASIEHDCGDTVRCASLTSLPDERGSVASRPSYVVPARESPDMCQKA